MIPFIIFTGKGREEVVIEAINSGADSYLQKGGDPRMQFGELGQKPGRWSGDRVQNAHSAKERRGTGDLPDATDIIRSDCDGRIAYDSPSSSRILGYPPGR